MSNNSNIHFVFWAFALLAGDISWCFYLPGIAPVNFCPKPADMASEDPKCPVSVIK